MHIGLCDVLDDDGNIVVPPSNRLVIRCRQEPSIVIDPGNCVDRAQMLVVLLRDLLLSQIVLNRWINGELHSRPHIVKAKRSLPG